MALFLGEQIGQEAGLGMGTIDPHSVRLKATPTGAARSLAGLGWVSEPQRGDRRATTLVTAEQDLALGHPSLAQSLAEFCHQRLIPPSELEDSPLGRMLLILPGA